ncbi:MAG: hypothetical protein J0M25_13010 [Flavobacteriales bacterium]|nr:hypothetical protein [Flavobacteriales bacterium]
MPVATQRQKLCRYLSEANMRYKIEEFDNYLCPFMHTKGYSSYFDNRGYSVVFRKDSLVFCLEFFPNDRVYLKFGIIKKYNVEQPDTYEFLSKRQTVNYFDFQSLMEKIGKDSKELTTACGGFLGDSQLTLPDFKIICEEIEKNIDAIEELFEIS